MKVSRVVLRKVHTPQMFVQLNIEIDNPDGTTKVITQYALPEDMVMTIHSDNETITCRINKDSTHYTGSYLIFRDTSRHSFISAEQVLDYTFYTSSLGYTINGVADRPPGVDYF